MIFSRPHEMDQTFIREYGLSRTETSKTKTPVVRFVSVLTSSPGIVKAGLMPMQKNVYISCDGLDGPSGLVLCASTPVQFIGVAIRKLMKNSTVALGLLTSDKNRQSEKLRETHFYPTVNS